MHKLNDFAHLHGRSPDPILEAAMAHFEQGVPVLPLTKDKKPYLKWEDYQARWLREGQTLEDIRYMFDCPDVPRYGLALLMHPYSPFATLDYDGPHAHALWQETGIELPETATHYTPSQGWHSIFVVPDNNNGIPRTIRIAKEKKSCGWKSGQGCGVDLIVNGYIAAPPTPGYSEDADRPFGQFAPLPEAVIALALSVKPTHQSSPAPPVDSVIEHGRRNDTLTSIAGTLRRRGLDAEEIFKALAAINAKRCRPPLPESEVREIAGSVSRYEPATDIAVQDSEPLTQFWAAQRFLRDHAADVRYCKALRSYLVWTGSVWGHDDVHAAEAKAEMTIRKILRDAAEIQDSKRREAHAQFAIRSQRQEQLEAILKVARPHVAVRLKDFDTDGFLFNAVNGTIDLRTGALRKPQREDFITKISPVEYDPQASCPLFEAFLNTIMACDKDQIRFLQKILGLSLTGDVREDLFFIFWGLGANGKTTLLRLMLWILGEYGKVAAPDLFIVKKYETHPTDYADLYGARLVTVLETGEGQRLNTAKIKVHTGRDPVKARYMYKDHFTFDPTYKVIFCTNHRPTVKETGTAMWRRLVLFPFDVEIPKAEQDKTLGEKLKAEGPGILRWLVEGCLLWQQEGLEIPKTVEDATKDYQRDSDPVHRFLEERCVVAEYASVTKKALFEAYTVWDQASGEPSSMGPRQFGQNIREKGFDGGASAGERTWKGMKLLDKK